MSPQTIAEKMGLAEQRSNIYGLLAMVYRQEPAPDLLQRLRSKEFVEILAEFGLAFDLDFLTRPLRKLTEELKVEYTGLFLGPGPHISPHESVHHRLDGGRWGRLWGDSTVKVKKIIEAAGLNYAPEFTDMPDHISAELQFMAELAQYEKLAWEKKDAAAVERCLDLERLFVDQHLSRWLPDFCDKVRETARSSFYREMAVLTGKFIAWEHKETAKSGNMNLNDLFEAAEI